jgi:hypothetical protein
MHSKNASGLRAVIEREFNSDDMITPIGISALTDEILRRMAMEGLVFGDDISHIIQQIDGEIVSNILASNLEYTKEFSQIDYVDYDDSDEDNIIQFN